ncbi:hypothetical protein ACP70R_030633 [Stipagrostis hirtigluma subsp. patula]
MTLAGPLSDHRITLRCGRFSDDFIDALKGHREMPFDLLPALHPRGKHWTICVRVSRMWEYRGGSDDGPIQHLDLVLLDLHGNAMYAEVPASEVESKQPLLTEGEIYVMRRFRVSNAKSFYKPVAAKYMIEFTCYTIIEPATDAPDDFPTITYDLVPLPELPDFRGDNRKFLDAIGIITRVSEVAMVHLSNQPAPTQCRDVFIKDLSGFEMKLTLWGQRALDFNIDAVRAPRDASPLVVLLVGTLMKAFQGDEYLSGNAACRWYFDPEIPEADQFYTTLRGQRIEIARLAAPSQQMRQPPVPPAQIEHKELADLGKMSPYDFPPNGYRCTVTIVRLVPGASWWFPSCNKCSKACVPDGAGYRCEVCICTSFKFKYKLCFIGSDGSAEAEMIAFGDVARRIVGKPVLAVLRASRYSDDVPPDVASVVSLRFTFGVTPTEQSYYRSTRSYVVNTIVTPYGRQAALPRLAGGGQGSSSASGALTQGRGGKGIQAQLPAPTTPPPKPVLAQQQMKLTPAASAIPGITEDLLDSDETPPERHVTEVAEKAGLVSCRYISVQELVFLFAAMAHHPLVAGNSSVPTEVRASKARKRLLMDDETVDEDLQVQADSVLEMDADAELPDKAPKRADLGKNVVADSKTTDVKPPRTRKAK